MASDFDMSCEVMLKRWGYLSATEQMSQVRYSSPRYGQRMSTKLPASSIPISKYAIVDIHANKLGIREPLATFYIQGWKFLKRKGWVFRPDGRRKSTAHKARAILARYMGLEEECQDS